MLFYSLLLLDICNLHKHSHIFEVSNLKVGSKLQFMLMCVMSTTTTLHTVKDGSHAQRAVEVGSALAWRKANIDVRQLIPPKCIILVLAKKVSTPLQKIQWLMTIMLTNRRVIFIRGQFRSHMAAACIFSIFNHHVNNAMEKVARIIKEMSCDCARIKVAIKTRKDKKCVIFLCSFQQLPCLGLVQKRGFLRGRGRSSLTSTLLDNLARHFRN